MNVIDIKSMHKKTSNLKGKDRTKYILNGELYCKGRLVLAAVNDYVSSNSGITFEKLKMVFPDHLQGAQGVFSKIDVIKEKFAVKSNNHHFMKPNEIISLEDCDITVCVDWTVSNIYKFIDVARSLGITVEVEDDEKSKSRSKGSDSIETN